MTISPSDTSSADTPYGMRLLAADVWVCDERALTDLGSIKDALYGAAEVGKATVLGELFHVFPNDAVTGVLVLAQSHLSIHTWPELRLANVDLLSYGALQGDAMLEFIERAFDAERVNATWILRATG